MFWFTEQSQCELHQEDNCSHQENVCVTVNENCLNSTTKKVVIIYQNVIGVI